MPQNLPVNDFKWVEQTSEFKEVFTKSHNHESDKGNFLKVDVQYPENLHSVHNDLSFLP